MPDKAPDFVHASFAVKKKQYMATWKFLVDNDGTQIHPYTWYNLATELHDSEPNLGV